MADHPLISVVVPVLNELDNLPELQERLSAAVAPLGDYESLAAHVLRLLDEPDWARSLARAAYDTCQACTWPSVRERWLEAYRSARASAERSTRRRQCSKRRRLRSSYPSIRR